MRVTVSTEDGEEQRFANIQPPTFQNGFLVLEGIWDTYLLSDKLITEIRIVEEENQMPINFTAKEYEAEVAKKRDDNDNKERDRVLALVVKAINAAERHVFLADADENRIAAVNDTLEADKFEVIRVGDRNADGLCKYRIKTLKDEPKVVDDGEV